MSRSQRKNPMRGITTAKTEKPDKQLASRSERRHVKTALGKNPDSETLPARRELSDVWLMAKDGKRYFDPAKFGKLLRK